VSWKVEGRVSQPKTYLKCHSSRNRLLSAIKTHVHHCGTVRPAMLLTLHVVLHSAHRNFEIQMGLDLVRHQVTEAHAVTVRDRLSQ